jgi:3D (Asp-Asp-Asp) domain-containing protein
LSRPEENAALMIEVMEHEIVPGDDTEMARFRHHRDFILVLSQVIPLGARLWLQGWLEAVAHGAFAQASRGKGDDIF